MDGVDRTKTEHITQLGAVKAALSMYGERILGEKPDKMKNKMAFPENAPSKARELHTARRDLGRFDDRRRFAESVKAKAERELITAQKTMNDLNQQIEESNSTTMARKEEVKGLKELECRHRSWVLAVGEANNPQCMEVMKELDKVKRELSKLKLDMASVLHAKTQAEKQAEVSLSRVRSYTSSMEAIKRKIEEVNEEEVLVELARMEAVRELKAIEAQREAEAAQFSKTMENTRKRIEYLIQEVNHSNELEMKLESTTSDANVLQSELNLVKVMDTSFMNNWDSLNQLNLSGTGANMREDGELASASLLQSATDELNEAKRELACIREEGFQFMASMDIIRNEMKHGLDEMAHLKKFEVKTDSTIKDLNSKLVRTKSKLESASSAEEKSRSIVSNLTTTLQQLQTETAAVKEERELIHKETTNIKLEIQKSESDIELEEERLQAAMQELEAVKASEALALESLRSLTQRTMKARAAASLHSSSITISDFEYEYLSQRAEGAEELADKKVAAAQAWIEALKAGEKEILMKTEMAHREIRELRALEEQEHHKSEKALRATKSVEDVLHNWRRHEEQTDYSKFQFGAEVPRKSMIENNGPMTPRHSKIRRPASPGFRYVARSPGVRYVARSGSFTLRKKRKVMPSLVKFFRRKKYGE